MIDTEEYYGGTYPEPNKDEGTTLKVECYFTTYITVTGDDEEDWERQLDETSIQEFIKETDKINIDSWEKIK